MALSKKLQEKYEAAKRAVRLAWTPAPMTHDEAKVIVKDLHDALLAAGWTFKARNKAGEPYNSCEWSKGFDVIELNCDVFKNSMEERQQALRARKEHAFQARMDR